MCDERWDSAWFRTDGSSRPAYRVLLEELTKRSVLAPATIATLDPPQGPGTYDTCGDDPVP